MRDTFANIDAQAGESLPGWVYHDPDFFKVEMERVIRPSWQIVCHVSDIPEAGDWHSLELLGESIIVIRGDDEGVYAHHNVCRHRASRLVDGSSGCARDAGRRRTCGGGALSRHRRITNYVNRAETNV